MKTIISIKSLVIALMLFTAVITQAQITHRIFTLSQQAQLQIGFTIDTSTLPTVTVADTTIGKIGKCYWVFDDGDFSNAIAPVHKYNKDGIYRISLTATDTATGCQSKIEKEIKIKTSTTEPCRANYTFTLDTLTKTLSFINISSTEIDRNYWEFGDGTLSNVKSPSHTYNAAGYYKVSLTVIDTNTICFDIKTIIIKVNETQKPCKADFTYNVALISQKIYLANHSDIPVNSNYFWDFADGNISTIENPEHTYTKGGYYDVCLTVSDQNSNCRNTLCQNLKASDISTFCDADFTYSVDTSTGNVNFYDNSKGQHNGWEWSYGDGTTDKNKNVKHKFNPGYYTVKLKITDSQTGCTSFNVSVINVNELQKIKAGVGYEKKADVAKGFQSIEFKGASYGDASELEWDFGDGETNNTSIAPTHDYSEGTYNACLTVSNAYTGQSDKSCQQIIVVITGLEKQTKNSSITIYPNPSKQTVTITYNSTDNVNSIEIINTIGQTVYSKQIKTANKAEQLDISSLQDGIYFIKVQTDNGNFIKKVVKN